jgi:hypothetical protein
LQCKHGHIRGLSGGRGHEVEVKSRVIVPFAGLGVGGWERSGRYPPGTPWNSSEASWSETSLETEDTFRFEETESDLCSAEKEVVTAGPYMR